MLSGQTQLLCFIKCLFTETIESSGTKCGSFVPKYLVGPNIFGRKNVLKLSGNFKSKGNKICDFNSFLKIR